MKQRGQRAAAAKALQKLREKGVLSPPKGIIRNSLGANQFPTKRTLKNVLHADNINPTTDFSSKRRF